MDIKAKDILVQEAMSGNIGAIYDLMIGYPKTPEILLLKTMFREKISSEIDVQSSGDFSLFSLRDYLRGDTGIAGNVLMYFKGKAVVPIKLSGELYFSDEQYDIIVNSNKNSEKEKFSKKEYYGDAGAYLLCPDKDDYIEYLFSFSEFKLLKDICPKSIFKGAVAPAMHELLYDRDPSPESYEFSSIQLESVPKGMDNLDFLELTSRSIKSLRKLTMVSDELIIGGFSFIDSSGKGVIVRGSSEGGVFDRVMISEI